MHNPTDGTLRKLCVHRALNEYVRRSGRYRLDGTAQLFLAYGGRVKGKPISKQRLSNRLVECIKFTYKKHDLPVLDRVKSHQTRKMAVTYADMAGADPQTMSEAAIWRNLIRSPGSTGWPTQILSSAGEFWLIHPGTVPLGHLSHTPETIFPQV